MIVGLDYSAIGISIIFPFSILIGIYLLILTVLLIEIILLALILIVIFVFFIAFSPFFMMYLYTQNQKKVNDLREQIIEKLNEEYEANGEC